MLVVSGDHTAAAAAAAALAGVLPDSAQDRYFAACFLARCVSLAADDPQLDSEQRDRLTRKYADESLASLREAVRRGFDDLPQLRTDRESVFQAVQARSEFQAVVDQLVARSSTP